MTHTNKTIVDLVGSQEAFEQLAGFLKRLKATRQDPPVNERQTNEVDEQL